MKFNVFVRSLINGHLKGEMTQLGPFIAIRVEGQKVFATKKLKEKDLAAAKRRHEPEIREFLLADILSSFPEVVWTFYDPNKPDRVLMRSKEWSLDM